jgi:hypothetical protein
MANKQTAGSSGYRPPKSNAPLMAVAVVAVAAAIGLLLILLFANNSPSSAASSGPTNGDAAPTQTYAGGGSGGGGTLAALPPLSGNGGGLMYMLNGKVAAISSTSITLAGNGPSVTAAINSSTRFSGDITSASGIKVGDQVTAQVGGQSSSSLVVSAIQDPGTGP